MSRVEATFQMLALQTGFQHGDCFVADRFQAKGCSLSFLRLHQVMFKTLQTDSARDRCFAERNVLDDLQKPWVIVFVLRMNLEQNSLVGLSLGQRLAQSVLIIRVKPLSDFVSQSRDVSVSSEVRANVQSHIAFDQRDAAAEDSATLQYAGQVFSIAFFWRNHDRSASFRDDVTFHDSLPGNECRFAEDCFHQPPAVQAGRSGIARNADVDVELFAFGNQRRKIRSHNNQSGVGRPNDFFPLANVATTHVINESFSIGARRRISACSVQTDNQANAFQHDSVQTGERCVVTHHRNGDFGRQVVVELVRRVCFLRTLRPHAEPGAKL